MFVITLNSLTTSQFFCEVCDCVCVHVVAVCTYVGIL